MNRWWPGLFVLAVMSFNAQSLFALDYFIPYAFDFPLGQGAGTDWDFGDSITYRADTGIVTYQVDAVGSDYTSWWPPDLASRGGALFEAPFLEEASPSSHYSGQILMHTNVEIEGVVVPGSNAVGPRYDGYHHWPFTIDDPQVLATWGPLGMPHSFSYSKILPPGLSEEFLRTDLYTFPLVNLVYVVPEPGGCAIVLFAVCAWSQCRRRSQF